MVYISSKKYKKEIETWRTRRLGAQFMTFYTLQGNAKISNPKMLERRLEIICEVLQNRPFDERKSTYNRMREIMSRSVKQENFEEASRYRDMMRYWERHVEQIPVFA